MGTPHEPARRIVGREIFGQDHGEIVFARKVDDAIVVIEALHHANLGTQGSCNQTVAPHTLLSRQGSEVFREMNQCDGVRIRAEAQYLAVGIHETLEW